MTARPRCPVDGAPIDRLQDSQPRTRGTTVLAPVVAYPCQCWLTPGQVRDLVTAHRPGDTDAH